MAFVNNQTFCGKDSDWFFSEALGTMKASDYIKELDGVKSSININSFNLGSITQTGSTCTWNEAGSGTLDDKNLAVTSRKINLEYCTDAFESSFLSLQMRKGSSNTQIPESFERYLLLEIAKKIGADMEIEMFNTLVTNALADSSVVDVAAIATSAMTSSTVITELNRVLAAIPANIRHRVDEIVIFVSPAVALAYREYLGAFAIASLGPEAVRTGALNYLGYTLVETTALSGVRMLAGLRDNFFKVTDAGTDQTEVKIIDMLPSTGVRSVRVAAFWKIGFDYAIGAEVVLYS